jgi:membrane protein DedA with SNARE-associated domain
MTSNMTMSTLDFLTNWFLDLGRDWGYLAVFFGAIADSLIPIVPSELIFGAAGFWVYSGYLNIFGVIFLAVFGNLLASALFWWAGKRFGTPFIDKFGKYLGFGNDDYNRAEKMFNRWGYFAVFVCQFVPLLRSVISIPSGVLHLNFRRFMIATGLGATVWATALVVTAYQLGANWMSIASLLDTYGKPLTILVSLIIIGLIAIWYLKTHKKSTVTK